MDALVVLGAWAGGSVVVSLAMGTLIARAERASQRRPDAARPAPVPTAVLSLLPRPRAAAAASADAAGQQLTRLV